MSGGADARATPPRHSARGFTLVEVLVALLIVTIGLAALLVAVSGTARTSGYLRDKIIGQWIALNRIAEVRLNASTKLAQNTDTGEVYMANRTWHYDTRYFDTNVKTMKRISVRVYAGDAKTKGGPVAQAIGFMGTALNPPGGSNGVLWNAGMTPGTGGASSSGGVSAASSVAPTTTTGAGVPTNNGTTVTPPQPTPSPNP